jgi:Ser/Thr protein kinase RdoA (MazF antagonist)
LTRSNTFSAPPSDNRPSTTPFDGLTPDLVLDALEAVGLNGDGRLIQLNSFENRVFQVMLDDDSAVIAKFYRPHRWTDEQIAEEHSFSEEAQADDIPVVAPLKLQQTTLGGHVRLSPAAHHSLAIWSSDAGEWRFAVWPRRAGRTPELEDELVLQSLGRCIARLHRLGSRQLFQHRHSLRPEGDAQAALDLLVSLSLIPEDQEHQYLSAGRAAVDFIRQEAAVHAASQIRLHGDCHPGNLLWRDDRPNMVDLDDACNGPAVQDLWMLLSGEASEADRQLEALIAGYEQVLHFDRRELVLITSLRLCRMIRHNAWVARRWDDPAFPRAYPDFGSSSYWAQQTMQLREQLAQTQAE